MNSYQILHGDCIEMMRTLPDNSVDAIVTDPPYGLSFMGKAWDYDVPKVEVWQEALRVLKPGGHLLAFAGTRTQHRMAVNIEDAGFEIRDMIAWVYGSGFPKSLNVSKAIDKQAGVEREVVGVAGKSGSVRNSMAGDFTGGEYMSTAPATDAAKQWQGFGTALKPALEPITVARKPLAKCMTVADNVLAYGTGAINVDGCRVGSEGGTAKGNPSKGESNGIYGPRLNGACDILDIGKGRWPANFCHDGSDEVVGLFPVTTSGKPCGKRKANHHWNAPEKGTDLTGFGDSGSAARFFYCAKASKRDRNEGLEGFEEKETAAMQGNMVNGQRLAGNGTPIGTPIRRNTHITVKPTNLMRYLCRLITPPNGTVLDPFMGSGSTGKAAMLEGFSFIGCELNPEYVAIAEARIKHVMMKDPIL